MNGVASAAMRHTDDYRVNYGIELPRLRDIAEEFGKNHDLAQALWKESVRECKILATLIQPLDTFFPDIADIWVENIYTAEIAQTASLYLFQYLPYATDKAFQWIASEREIQQICGFSTIYHIIRNNEFMERSVQEIRDQAKTITEFDNFVLQRLSNNILTVLEEKYGR